MRIRRVMSTITVVFSAVVLAFLAVAGAFYAVAPASAQVTQGAGGAAVGGAGAQNQGDLAEPQPGQATRYINPLVIPNAGRLADPTVIRFKDKYYLYATGGLEDGAVWSSDDLVNWEYHRVTLEGHHGSDAPAAFVHNGTVYINGNGTGLFRSHNPLGPFEYMGDFTDYEGRRLDWGLCPGCEDGGVFDPAFFVDDDNLVYLYFAGPGVEGIFGVQLDPDDFSKLLGPIQFFFEFEPSHIWERYGNRNEYSTQSWIEGPWMTKRNGTYYLQYGAPGTDWITYAVGVYTSENPLGPFTYYEGSPILVHRSGMLNGVGHNSVVEGPDGNLWMFYIVLYENRNREVERRIGMDPVGFDEHGNMFVDGPSETPQWAPGVQTSPWEGNDSGSFQLSEDKSFLVSSEAPGRDAPYAFDNNIRTFWAPTDSDPAPSLTLDLGAEARDQQYLVDSVRIVFPLPNGVSHEDAEPRIRQYKIEVSADGENFVTVVDKTDDTVDNAVEFDEIEPIRCRHVRLTLTGWSDNHPRGVVELTVFGKPIPE